MSGRVLIVKHIGSEGPGTILDFINEAGLPFEVLELERGDPLPSSLANLSAVISLGGPMNVYEESKYPFLAAEDIFIKQAIQARVPFLGVCLGAQLLAKAAGAKVYRAAQEEIGWSRVRLTSKGKTDPFFAGLPDELDVFQWHGDTFDIPLGGILLAQAEQVKNQAFKVGECAYGLQFHVEINEQIISKWFADSGVYLDKLKTLKASYQKQASQLYQNFFDKAL